MKNIKINVIFLIGIFFLFVGFVHAENNYIYYNANGSSSKSVFKKNANDSLDGTGTTLAIGAYGTFNMSPDGLFIYYGNSTGLYKYSTVNFSITKISNVGFVGHVQSDRDKNYIYFVGGSSNYIYKKNANDSTDGTPINSVASSYFDVSPDGTKIAFKKSSDSKMYLKNTNDSGNGILITNESVGYSIKFSNDGNYIYYTNSSGIIRKKNANNLSDGISINSSSARLFDISDDGQYIIYTNQSDSFKCYKKNANDSLDGIAITTQECFSPQYDIDSSNGSCTDGIQNQDEIGIDYGGVCTTSSEYRFDGCTQRTIKYYGTGATTVYNMGGLSNYGLFVADVSNESEWLKVFGLGQSKIEQYTFDDGTGLNYDLFKVYNIQYSDQTAEQNNPQVKSGSLVVTSGGPVSEIRTDTTTGKPPSIEIYSMRSGVVQKFDFVRFTGANYPTITKGSQTNYAGYVTWNTQKGIISSPLVLSGGIATAYLNNGLLADSAVINLQQQNSKFNGVYFQFSGFSFGLAGGSLSVTECGNGDFKCKMYVESATASPVCKPDSNSILGIGEACVYTTAFTTPVVINDAGDITTVTGNACIPNRKQGTIVTPDGFEVDYVVDQSGAVIQQNTRPISTGDFTEQCLSSDPGILEYVKCSFQFIGNQIKQLTTTTEKTTDIINKAQTGVKPNDTKTGSLELGQSQKQNTGNSLVNAVQNQYDAYDNGTDAFANVGTLMKWVLGAILTFVVILLFFALSGNRKQ